MASFAPTSAETLEDRRRYLEGHLAQVSCLDCLATVQVRKQSEFHTSIQWPDGAAEACPELTRARAAGAGRVLRTCSRLQASIAAAVADGALPVGGTVD